MATVKPRLEIYNPPEKKEEPPVIRVALQDTAGGGIRITLVDADGKRVKSGSIAWIEQTDDGRIFLRLAVGPNADLVELDQNSRIASRIRVL